MAPEYSREKLNEALGLGSESNGDDFGGEMVDVRKRGSVFGRIRFGLFGVLSLLAKRQGKASMVALLLSQFVNLMQLLSFTFNVNKGFPWSSWVSDAVLPVIEACSLSVAAFNDATVSSVAFVMAIFLLAMTLGTTTWIAYSFSSSSGVTTLWMLQPLRLALSLLTSVLYVPVLGLLLQIFDCESQLSIMLECSGPVYHGMTAFVCLLFVMFVMFTSLSVLVNFPRGPNSSNHTAKTHGRTDCLSLWLRAFLSVLFALVGDDQSLVLAVVLVGVAAAMTFATFYFLPFYKMEMNKIRVCSNGIFLLSTICLLLESLAYDADTRGRFGSFMAFAVAAPMVWFVTDAVVDRRCAKLTSMVHNGVDFDSPMLTEVAFRIALGFSQDDWKNVQQQYRRQVDERFPKNGFLTIHFAMLLHECGHNFILNQQYMNRAKSLDLWIDDRFFVFKHSLDAESRSTGVAGNAMNYMAFEHHSAQARKRVLEALDQISHIWKVIGTNKSTDELLSCGARLRKASQRANQHLEELLRLTTESPAVFKLYAYFLEYVLNDKAAAKVLEEHADLLEQMGSSDDAGFDDRGNKMHAANVTISGSENSLGEITDASMGMCTLFGMDKDQFLGKNVSTLTPPPFDKIHDMFLLKYIENNSDFVTRKVDVWGRHARGYAIPLHLEVRPSVDEVSGDLIFSGVFIPNRNTRQELIMVTGGTDIAFATKGGWEDILGIQDSGDDEIVFRQRPLVDVLSEEDLGQPLLQNMLVSDDRGHVTLNGTSYEVESKRLTFKIYNRQTKDSSEEIFMVLLHLDRVEAMSPMASVSSQSKLAQASFASTKPCSFARSGTSGIPKRNPLLEAAPDGGVPCSQDSGLDAGASSTNGTPPVLPCSVAEGSPVRLGIAAARAEHSGSLIASLGAVPTSSFGPGQRPAQPDGGVLSDVPAPHEVESNHGEDAGSIASSRSGRSTNARSVFERVSKGMARNERQLGTYRRRSLLVAIVCLVLAVSEWVNRMGSFSLDIDAAEQMHNSVRRHFLIVDSALLLREIIGINHHADEPNADEYREEMLSNMADGIDALREVHVSITESESASTDAIQELNAKASILTVVDATKPELNEEKNLWVAVHLFASYATEYLRDRPRECDESCKFILNSGPAAISDACQKASGLYLLVARDAISGASWYNLVFLSTTGIVTALWTVLFTIPSITRMRRRHERSSDAFRRIPRKTIRFMARQAAKRLVEVRDKLNTDADDDFEEPEEELDAGRKMASMRQPRNSAPLVNRVNFGESGELQHAHRPAIADEEGTSARPRQPVVVRRGSKVTPASGKRGIALTRRKLRAKLKSLGRLVGLVLRQSTPFFLTMGYMTSLWALNEASLDTRISLANLEYYAGARWVLAQQLLLSEETKDLEFPEWSVWHGKADERHAFGAAIVEELHEVHETLTLGDAELGIPPMANKADHPTQYEIFFENACFSRCKEKPDLQMSKLLEKGLQLGFTTFLNDVTEVGHDSLATTTEEKMELYYSMRILAEGLEHTMKGYRDEAREHYESEAFQGRILLICFALALLGTSIYVYKGYRGMNQRSQDVQFLMVVLPAEVLNRTPDLRSVLLEDQR